MCAVTDKCDSANSKDSYKIQEQAYALGIKQFQQDNQNHVSEDITLLEHDALVLDVIFSSGPPLRINGSYSYLDRNEIDITRKWWKVGASHEFALTVRMIEYAFQKLHKSLQKDPYP